MSSSFLSGRIALAARLALPLFDPPGQNCLASELASLFERSSVSLANRTFPPLRPPNLHVSKRHDVWILAIGRFNHPPDTHLLKIRDLLGSFRNSPANRLRVACGLLQMQEQPRTEDNAASCRHWSCQIALGRVLGLQGVGAESTIPVLPAATSTAEGAAKFSPSADRTLSGSDFAGDESSNPVSA